MKRNVFDDAAMKPKERRNAIGTGMILQYAVQKLATVIKGRIRGGL
jgi:hypothetical protein